MRLNNRGRYAVSAILELAVDPDNHPRSLSSIARNQAISTSYLEQIFRQLREAGLVTSVLGARGGYRLSRAADRITVSDVLLAVDEQLTTKGCKDDGITHCRLEGPCNCHRLWSAVDTLFRKALHKVTLQDVLDGTINLPQVD